MNIETLVTVLGKPATDPLVEETLRRFGVARRPALRIDPDDADGPVVGSQDWVTNLSSGIVFGFQEEGAFMGLDQADRGVGPLLLTEVTFHGARPGTRPYPLPLPFGLALDDDRAAVRARMAPLEKTRRSYVRDTWEHPAFRVTASYADGGTRIDFLVCMLRTEPPEPFEGGTAALPSVQTLAGLLGKRLDEAELRRVLVPLGLDRPPQTAGSDLTIDLRRSYGLRLGLQAPSAANRSKAGARLVHRIEFLRAGEFESRGWWGELPFGIRFDDSPAVALAKVGQPPAHQEDEDFSGSAFWELPDHSLQVIYSTMENIVLRVSLIASGG
jgi:hypothetical protein